MGKKMNLEEERILPLLLKDPSSLGRRPDYPIIGSFCTTFRQAGRPTTDLSRAGERKHERHTDYYYNY